MQSSQKKTDKQNRSNKDSTLLFKTIISFILILLIFSTWYFYSKLQYHNKISSKSNQTTPQVLKTKKISPSTSDFISDQNEIQRLDQKIKEDSSKTYSLSINKTKVTADCTTMASNLDIFFNQIDKKEYIITFRLDIPSQTYFLNLIKKILKNPPVVARESDDLFTLLKNMAHFFRIIGKKNILLIKTILDREAEKIEDIGIELYQYIITEKCQEEMFPISASEESVYEYASFFIHTMGGRSYLFRRDSRSRLLINYYSILIVDSANRNSMNKYGVEINKSISLLINEIETTTQLIYRETYLDTLYELSEKYPVIKESLEL